MDAFGVHKLLGPSKDPKVKTPVVINDPPEYKAVKEGKTTKATKPLPPLPKNWKDSNSRDELKAAKTHTDPEPSKWLPDEDGNVFYNANEHVPWQIERRKHVRRHRDERIANESQWYSEKVSKSMTDAFGVEHGYISKAKKKKASMSSAPAAPSGAPAAKTKGMGKQANAALKRLQRAYPNATGNTPPPAGNTTAPAAATTAKTKTKGKGKGKGKVIRLKGLRHNKWAVGGAVGAAGLGAGGLAYSAFNDNKVPQ